MKRSIIYLSMLLALCVGCKRVEVDFTYAPTAPRAGQSIAFTNLCTEGEDWLWTFGDNSTSLLKNPYKIYKKPGTYIVTLMVDSAKHNTHSKEITVYDTIPTFVCSTEAIYHYQDVTFTANVYNPYNYTLTYEWIVSDNCHVVGSNTSTHLEAYFKSAMEDDSVTLLLTQNGEQHRITKHFSIHLTQAPAIVMQLADGTIVRQRMISDRVEEYNQGINEDEELIKNSNDTAVIFNGETFYASSLASTIAGLSGMDIQHLQLDAMAQKWYITTPEGLYVANFDGSALVAIDATATGALHVDAMRNRLYWASSNGLKGMPLIKSKNNKFTTTPTIFNELTTITVVTTDNTNR